MNCVSESNISIVVQFDPSSALLTFLLRTNKIFLANTDVGISVILVHDYRSGLGYRNNAAIWE
jgi:hypothetical protein